MQAITTRKHPEPFGIAAVAEDLEAAKRSYMPLRPHLRRCYLSVSALETYAPVAKQLGFELLADAGVVLDGATHHLAVLDFGPGSIDGWLTNVVGNELGIAQGGTLDEEARELVLNDKRVALTVLEFGVMKHLTQQVGKGVSRADLLQQVWGQFHDGGSNVVDVVVRSLRKKLGTRSSMIETVRGTGYRLRTDG